MTSNVKPPNGNIVLVEAENTGTHTKYRDYYFLPDLNLNLGIDTKPHQQITEDIGEDPIDEIIILLQAFKVTRRADILQIVQSRLRELERPEES